MDKIINGDIVEIVEPALFIRCGYPMDIEQALDAVYEKIPEDVITNFINAVLNRLDLEYIDLGSLGRGSLRRGSHVHAKAKHMVYEALATQRLYDEHFGGNQRTIHIDYRPEYKGKFFRVIAYSIVKTGTYVPGYRVKHYDGDDDYEPAYLDNQKTHKIFSLVPLDTRFLDSIKIESTNIKKASQDVIFKHFLKNLSKFSKESRK